MLRLLKSLRVVLGALLVAGALASGSPSAHAAPPHAWGPAVGAITTVFALGQCVGPVLTGALSDQTGVRAGMALSAVLLAVGALVALAQPAD